MTEPFFPIYFIKQHILFKKHYVFCNSVGQNNKTHGMSQKFYLFVVMDKH